MDSFFGNSLSGIGNGFPNLKSFSFGGSFTQGFDIKDQENKYIVTLEVPGLDQTNVKINIEDQSLKVSGKNEQKHKDKNG